MVWSIRCAVVLSLCVLYASGIYLGLNENDVCKRESRKEWTCRKLTKCPKASEIINTGKASQLDICGYIALDPVVCCEPEVEVTTLPGSVKSISQRKCEEYGEAVYIETWISFFKKSKVDTCAAVAEPLITKGKNAVPREFPHMALIGYGDNNNSIAYLCGGSLISERYILSAAHCTDAGTKGLAKWARLGEYNIKSTEDENSKKSSPVVYEIEQCINHPEYQPPRLYNDIALYKLSRDVTFNEYIRPCCINYNPEISYKQVIATGWGHTEFGGRRGDILQKVNLNISDIRQCYSTNQAGRNRQLPNGMLPQSMFCASNLGGGDTCQGDSGGPLQIRLAIPHCMYSVLGVTSFGKECGRNNSAIYTRVSHFIPWIESIVWSS